MAKAFANSKVPDQMSHSAVSNLGVYTVCQLPFWNSPGQNGLRSFYFTFDNRSWYFIQILLLRESLNEMSNTVFSEIKSDLWSL